MAYPMLPWAQSLGKDEDLMSSLLRHAWTMGVGLHTVAAHHTEDANQWMPSNRIEIPHSTK
ncbi:MAG: hypothetical protein AAFV53_14940 [Myxococcota bacterium]